MTSFPISIWVYSLYMYNKNYNSYWYNIISQYKIITTTREVIIARHCWCIVRTMALSIAEITQY